MVDNAIESICTNFKTWTYTGGVGILYRYFATLDFLAGISVRLCDLRVAL